jgi:hypothetical protein
VDVGHNGAVRRERDRRPVDPRPLHVTTRTT